MVSQEESDRTFGGRYRLLEFIGEGSNARVYLAEDLTLRRRVALKILGAEAAGDESFLERFAEEMRATSALNHPRVLPVYDWGLHPHPYTVTEHLAGGSLAELLKAGHRLTASQVLVVGLEAARALVNIHAGGRAHLGLVSSAILFDSGARPYISDLGLSAALAAAALQSSADTADSAEAEAGDTEPGDAASAVADADGTEPAERGGEDLAAPGGGSDEQRPAPGSYSPSEQAQDVHDLALSLCEAVTGARDLTVGGGDAAPGSVTVLGPLQTVLERATAPDLDERSNAADLAEELLRVATLLPRPDPLPIAAPDGLPAGPVAATTAEIEALEPDSPSVSERSAVPLDDVLRRRWPGIALAAVLVLGGATAGIWAWVTSGAETAPVPDLQGSTRAAASASAAEHRWEINEILVREPGTERGEIVRTEPAAGASLGEGATLEVFVSLGEPLIPVSDLYYLYGMTMQDATDELEDVGLIVQGETPVSDSVVPEGLVVGLDVGEGVYELEVGDEVGLLVSDGPAGPG